MPSLPALLLSTILALSAAACGGPVPDELDAAPACDCSGIPRRFPAPCRCTLEGTVECDPDVELPDTCTDECFCDKVNDAGL